MEKLFFYFWRKRLFSSMKEGKFLEVGVGTGKNLKFYPKIKGEKFAIDISEKMLKFARTKAEKFELDVNFKVMNVEKLEFEDNFFDFVLGTFVFCSVAEPLKGLKEINRVLKPQGRLFLIEHVKPQNWFLGKIFDLFNPLIKRIMGPNINRRTVDNLRRSGFKITSEINLLSDIFKFIVAQPIKVS